MPSGLGPPITEHPSGDVLRVYFKMTSLVLLKCLLRFTLGALLVIPVISNGGSTITALHRPRQDPPCRLELSLTADTAVDTSQHTAPDDAVLIDCEPYGLTAALNRSTWRSLRQFKLNRLRLLRGHVYALGERSKVTVARLMTGTEGDATTMILYRNGNPLDLRRENVVTFRRSTYLNATRPDATPAVGERFKDGSRRPRGYIAPVAKLAAVRSRG